MALLPLAAAGALLASLVATGPVHATGTTITVTGFDDGAGTCPDSSHCTTLRAAVLAANEANDGATVVLPAGTYTLSQPADSTSLVITAPMTIMGAGSATTVVQGVCNSDQAWAGRLFTVDTDDSNASVTITGLTLSGGRVVNTETGDGSDDGGAILVKTGARLALTHDVVSGNEAIGNGGGVAVDDGSSTLSASDTIVKDNTAGTSASQCGPQQEQITAALNNSDGGGVFAQGAVSMSSSSVASNVAGGNGGGLYLEPSSGATDTLTRLFVHDNTAMGSFLDVEVGGGGIYDELRPGTHVVLDQSTISHNHAVGGNGGGSYEDGGPVPEVARVGISTGTVTVTNTTYDGNTAAQLGGAMYAHGQVAVTMVNSTVNGNSARNGGAIATGLAVVSHLALESVTVDGNSATGGLGGALFLLDGTATVHNSILALNSANPQIDVASVVSNCALGSGVLSSLGYNMADDATCALLGGGDQQPPAAVPALGALQDNGGPTDGAAGDTSPTLTQATTTGSTALDSGDPDNFPSGDERGVSRPQSAPGDLVGLGTPKVAAKAARVSAKLATGPRVDIGAFEAKVTPVIVPVTPGPGGTQGVIAVPSTGGGPEGGLPGVAVLAGSALLVAVAGALAARRRR